jgi:O-antigen ligase
MIFVFIASNLWVLPEAVRERIEMTVSGEQLYGYGKEIEPSAAGRVEAWKATISLVMGRPFLGYGLGMVGTYLGYYAGLAIGDVHNSYLLLAAEYGLVTLLVFLATIFAGIRVSWYVYNNSRDEILKGAALGFMVGILGLMVNCFFGSHMTTLWEIGYFWVLLAVFANEEKELRSEIAGLAQA